MSSRQPNEADLANTSQTQQTTPKSDSTTFTTIKCESPEPGIVRKTLSIPSVDEVTSLHVALWQPEDPEAIRGVVQIVHDMSEHIGRYEEFALFLARNGFVVCGHDHMGHGKTALDDEERGFIPSKKGADILIKDVCRIKREAKGRFAEKPFFWFGHGMGSFIVRNGLYMDGRGLDGAILSGTGHWTPSTPRSAYLLARLVCLLRGDGHRSSLLHFLAGGFSSRKIGNRRTEHDWLNSDQFEVDAYLADPSCGTAPKAGAYAALFDLMWPLASLVRTIVIQKGASLLFVSGEEDPMGNFGKGVRKAADSYLASNIGESQIEVKLYEGMRHDILHEPGNAVVYEEVLCWLSSRSRSD